LIRLIKEALMWHQKKEINTSYSNIPLYIYKKQVAQLKLKTQYRRKTDDELVSTKKFIMRDQLLVTGFWR
jgi:hypothetical protein